MASGDTDPRRVLFLPSSGMGHIIPFIRLATTLSSRNISASILALRPTISVAESRLLSNLPPSLVVDFPLPPIDLSSIPPSSDPFFIQMESFRRSVPTLPSFLSTFSPPFSSFIIDIAIASTFLPIAAAANIPCFVQFPSCASMLALCSAFPLLPNPAGADIIIADGLLEIPKSSLPGALRDPNHLFTAHFSENGRELTQATGILVNTFSALEPEILSALKEGEVRSGLPPVITIGPLPEIKLEVPLPSFSPGVGWLDGQPEKSVLYVCFGSRTALSRAQIRELGAGLEKSGCRFLWVLKSTKVDREEVAETEELVGEGYVKRVEERGLILRGWVEQDVVLGHPAVGGFMSHSGWNSVMEAAAAGVRMLAWPLSGDQRVNAPVVVKSGLGKWPEEWAWEGEGVVAADEIAAKVKEVMGDEEMAETAAAVRKKALAAVKLGGTSDLGIVDLIRQL